MACDDLLYSKDAFQVSLAVLASKDADGSALVAISRLLQVRATRESPNCCALLLSWEQIASSILQHFKSLPALPSCFIVSHTQRWSVWDNPGSDFVMDSAVGGHTVQRQSQYDNNQEP